VHNKKSLILTETFDENNADMYLLLYMSARLGRNRALLQWKRKQNCVTGASLFHASDAATYGML